MRKGYTVRTAWQCSFGDTIVLVSNIRFTNEVVNYPFVSYNKEDRKRMDVGVWRIKQLKK
jgi:hypothetical protein